MSYLKELENIISEKFTVDRMQELYDEYNEKYFNNELPDIPLKTNRSRRTGGTVLAYKNKATGDIRIEHLTISNFFEKDEEALKKIMLHEMIHVYFLNKGIIEGHGARFERMRKELSEKSGIDIPRTEDVSAYGVSDDIKSKMLDLLIYKRGDDHSVYLFKKDAIGDNLEDFVRGRKFMFNAYPDIEIYGVQSDDRRLLKYPVKRIPRLKYNDRPYALPKEIAQDLLSGKTGKVVYNFRKILKNREAMEKDIERRKVA